MLIGEMRDLETVESALKIAETGHLTFGTLHTNSTSQTINRIIDIFPAGQQGQIRTQLSLVLEGIVCQALLPKIGGGRVAAREILLTIPAVSNLIREGKTFQIPSVMQTSKGMGMVTMNDALLTLVKDRIIEPREAWTKATDKTGLSGMLKNAGLPTQFS